MVAIGPERFREMLDGFHAMDEHFRTAPLERNLPVILGSHRHLVRRLPRRRDPRDPAVQPVPRPVHRPTSSSSTWRATASRCDLDGRPVAVQTGPIVWGTPGTNGQHAYYQLIHQGTKLIPADFIGFVHAAEELGGATGGHQDLLMANFLAQTEALAFGKTAEEVRRGGRPGGAGRRTARSPATTRRTRSWPTELDPRTLGALVALYEHKVFTQGTIWGIDSFDQWGVELGKSLAVRIAPELTAEAAPRARPRQLHERADPPLPAGQGPRLTVDAAVG